MEQASDQNLRQLLDAAGAEFTLDALDALIDGVNASPAAPDDEAWCALIADPAEQTLIAGLQARRTTRAAGRAGDAAGNVDRVVEIRRVLGGLGVDGFMLPRADEHQGEFLPARAERLAWLTGFTGSAGMAIVMKDRAVAFTDGRYTLQIAEQVDTDIFETLHIIEQPVTDWIADNLSAGQRLAYDPWLHTATALERYRIAVAKVGAELVALEHNPIDLIWVDQPSDPIAPVLPHSEEFAGVGLADKRDQIAKALRDAGEDAVVLTSPESIAWLLNIRGGDVPRTPLALSFLVLQSDGAARLFIDQRKLTQAVRLHLGNSVALSEKGDLSDALRALGAAGATVRVDPAASPARVIEVLEEAGATLSRGEDPVVMPRACKNPVELDGTRAAHLRDAVAFARFLHWFSLNARSGSLDEMTAADALRGFRAEHGMFRDLSFDTISGSGPNGAIVHYRVTPESNRVMGDGDLYLVDSGAQYPDGTTDITRTLAVGTPGAEECERFTRVMQGHIGLAAAVFPKGTSGSQLDTFARAPLWRAGLDFDHGTGHGVGSYLGVHEGPQRISKAPNSVALRPGMIISNEPGYYKTGAYGIRCENLVIVEERDVEGAERAMFGLETITLAPFDLTLIALELLSADERNWLNLYHRRVREVLTPLLDDEVGRWLADATREI